MHLIEITKWKGSGSYTKVRWLFYFDTCFQISCLGNHATVSIDQLEATVKKHKKNNLIIKADIVKKLAAQSVSKDIQPPTQLGKRSAIELGEDLLPAKGGRTVAEYNTAQLLVDLSPNKLKARMPTYDTAQLLVDLSPNKIKAKPKKETKAAKEAKESKEAEELAKLNDGIVNV